MAFVADRLFPEIWRLIFEDVARQGYAGAVLQLMLVCRAWKVVATPLAYRHLQFRQTENLRAFLLHLVSCHIADRSPGDATWTLIVDIPDYGWERIGEHAMADIPALLCYLPNLRSFSFLTRIIPRVLALLLRKTEETLHELSVHLRSESNQIPTSFEVIRQFTELRQLSVTLPTSHDDTIFEIDPNISMNMPYLRRLKWGAESHAPPFFAVLSKSQFPVLDHLELGFGTPPEMSFQELDFSLAQFLTTHGPQLVRLDLDTTHYDHIPIKLCPILQKIGFHGDIPALSFLQQLPNGVDNVYLQLPPYWSCPDAYWSSLDMIILHASSLSFTAIHFGVTDSPQFAWNSRGHLPYDFMGRFLGKVLKLAAKGVMVFDPKGNGLQFNSSWQFESQQT